MKYTVTCPACDEEFTIDAEPVELADEEGCYADCPECGETEIEFDYDPETDKLTATPDQYEDDETCATCGEHVDVCTCEVDDATAEEDEEDAEN